MSLEEKAQHIVQELQGLTDAVLQLAATLRAQPLTKEPPKTPAGGSNVIGATRPQGRQPAAAKKEESKGGVLPDYDAVKSAILQLAQDKGRNAAVEVLAKFGATSGKDLKAEQYPAVMQALKEYGTTAGEEGIA